MPTETLPTNVVGFAVLLILSVFALAAYISMRVAGDAATTGPVPVAQALRNVLDAYDAWWDARDASLAHPSSFAAMDRVRVARLHLHRVCGDARAVLQREEDRQALDVCAEQVDRVAGGLP
jgi:hypothetical protein